MVLAGAFLFPSALTITAMALIRIFCPAVFSGSVTWVTEAWEKLRRNRIQQKLANSFFIRRIQNIKIKKHACICNKFQLQIVSLRKTARYFLVKLPVISLFTSIVRISKINRVIQVFWPWLRLVKDLPEFWECNSTRTRFTGFTTARQFIFEYKLIFAQLH